MVIKNWPFDTREVATGSPSIQDVTLVPSGTITPSKVAVPKKILGGTSPGEIAVDCPAGQVGTTDSDVGAGPVVCVGCAGGTVGAAVPVGAAVVAETGIRVKVGDTVGVSVGSGVRVDSSEPPQPMTANVARATARIEKNLKIERTLV